IATIRVTTPPAPFSSHPPGRLRPRADLGHDLPCWPWRNPADQTRDTRSPDLSYIENKDMSILQRLTDRGLIKPPRWLPGNVQYETVMGSVAYGVSSDASDVDVYGWAIPPREDIFPHLRGELPGFGRRARRFEQFQEHHVRDPDALAGHGRSYDLTIFGIVKF